MPHHARCVSSFRLGIRISSGCGKVFPGASLPGRLSLLAGLRPASPGPAVLIRGDDPPDPHDRGSGWFCHWRRDGPRTPTVPGLRCRTRLWLWPVALGRRWLAIGDLPLAVAAPGPPRCRVSVVAPGSGCGRWRLGDVGLPLEICHLRGDGHPRNPRCEGCAVTGHAAPGRELLLSQLGGWSLALTVGRSPV